jgi:hypothetical protein
MKAIQYCDRQLPHSGTRFGFLFNDTTVVDLQLLWQRKFEEEGFINAKRKSLESIPNSIHRLCSHYLCPLDFFKQSLELFKNFSQSQKLKTLDGDYFSFDLRDSKNCKLLSFCEHNQALPIYKIGEAGQKECLFDRAHLYYSRSFASDDLIEYPNEVRFFRLKPLLLAVLGQKDHSGLLFPVAFGHSVLFQGFDQQNELVYRAFVPGNEMAFEQPSMTKDSLSLIINDQPIEYSSRLEEFDPDLLMSQFSKIDNIKPGDLLAIEIDEQWQDPELNSLSSGDKIEVVLEGLDRIKNIIGTPT